MEQAQQEKVYMERLPLVAMQIRSALGNIYYGMQKLAPADERDEDPILDANAAMLYHGYFRLLRLAKNLESASMLNRKELLPTENTDLKVWLDEIIREAEVPFELKGVQLEMVCEERYAITAVNEPWLSQALWQLLSNALKACSAGGKVTVTLADGNMDIVMKNGNGEILQSRREAGNKYIYTLVNGEEYTYYATKDTYYHAEETFTLNEENAEFTVSIPQAQIPSLSALYVGLRSSLPIEALDFGQKFTPETHSYTAVVPDNQGRLAVWADPADGAASALSQIRTRTAHGKLCRTLREQAQREKSLPMRSCLETSMEIR